MSDVTDANVQDERGVLRLVQQVASTSNFDDWTTRFIRNTLTSNCDVQRYSQISAVNAL